MSIDSQHAHFYNWMKTNGGRIHEHVRIDTKEERGLFVTSSVETYSALAVVPWSLVVNSQHPDLSTIRTDTERQALIVFLLREYAKQETSFWFPWINLLNIENEAETCLNNKMHLFSCVEYSTLGQALTARYQQLHEEYEQLSQSDRIVETSLELFCAVDHLLWSRVLDLPENEPLSLVPFVDFANHSLNPNARWFIDDKTHDLVLRSERTLTAGEEITISYGSKSNEELLYLYGFTLVNNPNDRLTLPVSLQPDDILLEEKLQLIRELELPPRLTFDLHGHLDQNSTQLAKILSLQSEVTMDQQNDYYRPYLTDLLNGYLQSLNTCSEEQSSKSYLDSQKLIARKAIDNLK